MDDRYLLALAVAMRLPRQARLHPVRTILERDEKEYQPGVGAAWDAEIRRRISREESALAPALPSPGASGDLDGRLNG